MQINIKDKLRSLRTQKNITQEALANHLGITPQSVGKWERGEGFPDITLLPKLALFFNITVDELLNVGQARIEEKIKAYQEQDLRLRNAGENQKLLEMWEKAYSEFPNDCRVICGLMEAMDRGRAYYQLPSGTAERKISLGKRILEESTDNELRERAVQALCYTYSRIGDKENALRYAKMGGSMYITRDDLCAFVLDGEEGREASQEYIAGLLQLAAFAASSMPHKVRMDQESRIKAYEFGIELWKLFFSDGNYGFYAQDISLRYRWIADEYAFSKDAEKVIESLEKAVETAVISAKDGDREMCYTSPLAKGMKNKPSEHTKNYKGNTCNISLEHLAYDHFDFIRGDERFKKLKARLEKYAEKL